MEYGEETGLAQPGDVSLPRKYSSQLSDLTSDQQRDVSDGNIPSASIHFVEPEEETEEEEQGEEEDHVTLSEDEILIERDELSSSSESSIAPHTAPWMKIELGDLPWDDSKRPFVKLLDYNELQLDEDESDGIVSDRMIASELSYLCKSPVSGGYILAKVELSNKHLVDISILGMHPFLQYVDLSENDLTDITSLGSIPYLMYLDVSHNQLTSVLRFKAPKNLSYVNYSFNNVEYIDDLTDFWSITTLKLSHNYIVKIDGLQNLKFLRDLDLSFNRITCFENLNHLQLTTLHLESNYISTFEEGTEVGMKTMLSLEYINISDNKLSSLALFQNVYHLRSAEVQKNNIKELLEVDFLRSMVLIHELDLSDNPIVCWPSYRGLILNILPSLTLLDSSHVSVAEKVASKNMFTPDLCLSAARNHARVLMLEQLYDHNIDLDILPVDQGPFPLVILVGPQACKKSHLVRRLVEKVPEKVRAGISHTTRRAEADEIDGVNYHFVSQEQFNELAYSGMFLAITEILGCSYGFSKMELVKCVQQRKLCLTHMDIIGATALYNRSLQPRLVLTIPESKDRHLDHLRLKYVGMKAHSSGAVSIKRRTLPEGTRASTLTANMPITQDILEEIVHQSVQTAEQLPTYDVSKTSKSKFDSNTTYSDYEMIYEKIFTADLLNNPALQEAYKQDKSKETGNQSVSFKYSDQNSNVGSENSSCISTSEESASQTLETEQTTEEEASVFDYRCSKSTLDVYTVEDMYIRAVLQTRETYFALHDQNPGFFSQTLYTDDLDKAYHKLYKFIKDSYTSRPEMYPVYSMESDNIYKHLIPQKLARFMDVIHKHHQIGEQQSDTKAFKQPFISERGPSVMVKEREKLNASKRESVIKSFI